MGPIGYRQWEKALKEKDYSRFGELDLNKVFVFFALDQLKADELYDERLWNVLISKLDPESLTVWEKIELSLYPYTKDLAPQVVDNALESVVRGVKLWETERTLVHVHVPKAAGTSVNRAFVDKFYHSDVSLPGNNTPMALRLAFKRLIGKVPFLTTGHLPVDWLVGEPDLNASQFFLIYRDHVSRINSMRNQILSSLLTGNFFNRPYAYKKKFYLAELVNRHLFPINNTGLTNTVSSSISENIENAEDAMKRFQIQVVNFSELNEYLHSNFDVTLVHEAKNRTYNLSRVLPDIPIAYYEIDNSLF